MCRGNGRRAGRARNPTDLSSRVKRESRKIFGRGIRGHQELLRDDLRRRGPLRNKGELEVAADEYGERGERENAPLRASESVQNPEPGSAEGV
jgi:hypothetical protein